MLIQNSSRSVVLALSIIIVLFSSTVFAMKPSKFLKLYDLNNDKQVSKAEFKIAVKQLFDKLDKNGDKKISIFEFRQRNTKSKKRPRFTKMDVNADGKISQSEFLHAKSPAAQQRFNHLDINRDGFITRFEFSRRLARAPKNINNKRFTKFDSDKDGTLSEFEILSVREKWFHVLDRNNDSLVSEQEIEKMQH